MNDLRINAARLDETVTHLIKEGHSQPSAEAVKTGAEMLLGSQDSVVVVVGDYTKVKDQLSGFSNITFLDLTGKSIPEPK